MTKASMPGQAMSIEPIRLFISSPGDVQAERIRVVRAAERLQGLTDGLAIDVYRWEGGHYFSAHADFQRQIDAVEDFDVVISIFWSRLGTPPPVGTPAMPDGRPYPSGTAFEVLRALDARRRGAERPDVLMYRKTASPPVSATDSRVRADQVAQLDRLDAFIHEWFANTAEGFKGAFTPFETTDEFEALVEAHLAAWIAHHRSPSEARRWRVEERGSPFVGLDAFGPQHRDVFFGRRGDIERSRERLEAADAAGCGFLLIEGASGVGKSSLALAGLAPRLIERDPDLRMARMRPGDVDGPLTSLARALFADGALPELADGDYPDPSAFARHLAAGTGVEPVLRALARAASATVARFDLAIGSPVRLLLVVDQLEEAFGRQVAAAQRTRLAETLWGLAQSRKVLVVATLRVDARADALAEPALAALIDAGAGLALSPPGPDALSDIVRGPAAAAGIAFERGPDGRSLDEALIVEAGGPAALPLLQFTLAELYDRAMTTKPPNGRRPGDTAGDGSLATLTFADYHALGGLAGAVSRQAEAAFAALPEPARAALPRLVRALTDAGGYGETAAPILRAAPVEEASPDAAGRTLVEALAAARIVSRDGARLRFTHETALTAWARAAAETARSASFLRIRAEVGAAAARWYASGERRDLLIPTGVRLEEARAVLSAHGDELPGETRRFILVSYHRARRGHTLTAAAAVLFALIAIGAVWFQREAAHNATVAEREQARAEAQIAVTEREARRARSAELVTRARSLLDAGPGRNTTAALLALESLHLGGGNEAHDVIAEVMARLPANVRNVPHGPGYSHLRISADGDRHLVWTTASVFDNPPGRGEALVLDPASGAATRVALHDGWVEATPSADGRWLAVTGYGLRLQVIDLAASHSVLDEPLPAQGAAAFAPDGRTLYVLRADGVLERRTAPDWALASAQRVREGGRFDHTLGLDASPDGARLLLRFWQGAWLGPPDGPFRRIPDLDGRIYPTAFAPTGDHLVTVSRARQVTIRDAANGTVTSATRDDNGVTRVAFSADGAKLAIGDEYGAVEVWDVPGGKLVFAADLDRTSVTGLSFMPDGASVVSVHESGVVRLTDAATGAELGEFVHGSGDHASQPTFAGPIEADGTLLIGSRDGLLVRFDTTSGQSTTLYRAGVSVRGVGSARPIPDSGRLALTLAHSDWAYAWTDLRWIDAANGEVLWRRNLPGVLENAVFSPDGTHVATSVFARDANVTLWDLATGAARPVGDLKAWRDGLWFSADGTQLIARADALVVANAVTGETLRRFAETHGVDDAAVAAGAWRALTRKGSALRVWNLRDGTEVADRIVENPLSDVALDPEGTVAAYRGPSGPVGADGPAFETIELWMVDRGKVRRIPVTGEPQSLSFDPSGQRIAALLGAHTIGVWEMASGRQIATLPVSRGAAYPRHMQPTFIGDGEFLLATETATAQGAQRPFQLRGWHLPESGGAVEVLRLDRPWRHWPAPGARLTWGSDAGRRLVDLAGENFDGIAFPSAGFCCRGVVGTDRLVLDIDYERIAALDVTTGTIVEARRNPASDSLSAAAFSDDLAHAFLAERDTLNDERVPGAVRWDATASGTTRAEVHPDATISHILPIGADAALLLGSPGGTIVRGLYERAYLWHPDADVFVAIGDDNPIGGAALTPDQRFVVLRESVHESDESGRYVVAGTPRITVWDAATGARVDRVDLPERATDIAFTSDGARMVYRTARAYHVRRFNGPGTERSGAAGDVGAFLTERDFRTGEVERGHASGQLAVLADRWIAMPDALSLRLISLEDGRTVSLPHGADHPAIVLSGDPEVFATASARVLRVWRVNDNGASLLRSIGGVRAANQVVFAGPDNALHVAAGEALRRIRYRVEEIEPELCRRLGRGLDEAEKRTWFAHDTPTDPCSGGAVR
jgi:WD40 repeat protein